MSDHDSLRISVTFPLGYSGSAAGAPEELPDPVRLHEAFVAAAAGGPWAEVQDRVLVPRSEHRHALEWLEQHEPLEVLVPQVCQGAPELRRYRWRASPVALSESEFEPRTAMSGPAVYRWPPTTEAVRSALEEIAAEVTHVGRADSIVRVEVDMSSGGKGDDATRYARSPGRGPGRVMRVPLAGRTQALLDAHLEASRRGGHTTGGTGKQAADRLVTGGNPTATALRRYAPAAAGDWPFEEVWALPLAGGSAAKGRARIRKPASSVREAVAVHRAIVRAIGEDVPSFVSGREGDGPLRGAGHLAIHFADGASLGGPVVLLGIPTGVIDADREVLLSRLQRPLQIKIRRAHGSGQIVRFVLEPPRVHSALPFWGAGVGLMRTKVPMTLDVTGRPRKAPWSVEDAVVCSVGYAMRGVLERDGLQWEPGWGFRRELVAMLRDRYGVAVAVRRVTRAASSYVHRANEGELVVAVSALVNLGELKGSGGGFLALGRARHLGGGLLVPMDVAQR